jgi:molybdopterin synthase sulfur carrier subunit
MQVQVLFFGELAEIVGENSLFLDKHKNMHELKEFIIDSYPKLKNKSYQLALNNQICTENIELNDKDCIAFLPPFAGG